jgi:arabinoxylan arabinofuranohydrolase
MMNKTTAYNPYLPGYEYIPDGEPYVFGDRVYVFGSHDISHGKFYCLGDYVCWSAPIDDLGDWRYEGVIYEKTQDPLNKDGSHALFAPDVAVGPDGRYYLYYALDFVGKMAVAVCDEPAGKYEFYGFVHYKKEDGIEEILTEDFPFDPGVLVDDDGRVYMYYGFCPWIFPKEYKHMPSNKKGALVVELEQDMITIKEKAKNIVPFKLNSEGTGFEGHAFFEASSMRKINDTYYFIYSSHEGHELCFATSKYPDKDFKYGGIIVSNGDIGLNGRKDEDRVSYTGNNHGSIVKIKDKEYIFYHRHTQATQFSRQGCAEEIQILADGSIPQVEMTSCGLNGEPLSGKGTYSADICCNMRSKEGAIHIESMKDYKTQIPYVQEESTGDGETDSNQYVANIKDGTQLGYKYFYFDGTQSEIEISVRGEAEGAITIYIDGVDTEIMTGKIGTDAASLQINVKNEKEWINYRGKFADITGIHSLYFVFTGNGSVEFNCFTIRGK